MKRIAILPLIVTLACGMLSGDSADIVTEAKAKTDMQIEAAYSGPVDPVVDAIQYNFRELRRLIDSLNVEAIMAIERADSASRERDSAAMVLLALVAENTQLKAENKEYEKDLSIISWGPNIIMLMVCCFIATLISHGVYEAIKQKRKLPTHES